MALIICKECGNRVSTQATVCPKCGCPVSESLEAQQTEVINKEELETVHNAVTPSQDVNNIQDSYQEEPANIIVQESSYEDKPKGGKGFIKILIVVIILIVLGGSGYFFYGKYQQDRTVALYAQGYDFYNGYGGVAKDYSEAEKCFREASDKGYGPAQYQLGLMYEEGKGVDKNPTEAARLYSLAVEPCHKAAEKGDTIAQCVLGLMYQYGKGVNKNMVEAVKWIQKSAEQGYARAQSYMGNAYSDGCGVEKDLAEAVKWWLKAAEQGEVCAQYNLGCAYLDGKSVDRDQAEAVKWFRMAAEQGNVDAMLQLGNAYDFGSGVEEDKAEAFSWYHKAADLGDTRAMINVGLSYFYDEYGHKDLSVAKEWLRKAAAMGNDMGDFWLDKVEREEFQVDEEERMRQQRLQQQQHQSSYSSYDDNGKRDWMYGRWKYSSAYGSTITIDVSQSSIKEYYNGELVYNGSYSIHDDAIWFPDTWIGIDYNSQRLKAGANEYFTKY